MRENTFVKIVFDLFTFVISKVFGKISDFLKRLIMLRRCGLTLVESLNIWIGKRRESRSLPEEELKQHGGDGGVIAGVVGQHEHHQEVLPVQCGVIDERC